MPSPAGRRPRLRLATRGSPLAHRQTEMVAALLRRAVPGLEVEPVVVSTRGDRQGAVPLDRIGGQGVFVKEIQAVLIEGGADVAVHSAKDLPPVTPEGLLLAAVPERADPRDALIGRSLAALPPGGLVATGSARRRAQLANVRPDLTFVELRGNMARRIDRAGDGSVDAVVTAVAALERLGWLGRIAEVLPTALLLPQVGQGALAVECRAADAAVVEMLGAIDDAGAHRTLTAERAFLAAVGGSCTVPVGAWAEGTGDGLRLQAMMASGDGRVLVRAKMAGDDPVALGRALALHLLEDCGGSAIDGWDGLPEAGGPAAAR